MKHLLEKNRLKILFCGLVICFILALVNAFIPLQQSTCKTNFDTYRITKKSINGKKYSLLIADTDASHSHGLMEVKTKADICGNDGMLFQFPDIRVRTFWNKNTLIDLDIYWIDGEKIQKTQLPKIACDTCEPTIISSNEPATQVVEIIR